MVNLLKIRDLCKKNRISLKRLSEDIGISETGLQYILNNNTTSAENLYKIAKYFNVPVGYFFDEIELAPIQNGNIFQNSNGNIITQTMGEQKCMQELDKTKKELNEAYKKIIELQDRLLGMG